MHSISKLIVSAFSRLNAVLLLLLLSTSAWADSLAIMSGAGQSGLGGSAGAKPIVVQVRNVDGAVIAGRTITWTTSNGFVLSAASSITNADGLASVSFTYGNAGTTNIVATDPTGGTSASAPETSIGTDSLTLISGDAQTGQVGSTSRPLVVELLSPSGAPRAGRSIAWSSLDSNNQVTAASSLTDATGRAAMTFRYIDGQPPNPNGVPTQVRATDSLSGLQVTSGARVIGFGPLVSIVSGVNQSLAIGATSAPLVVKAVTWDGQPLVGVSVNFTELATTGGLRDGDTSHITLSAATAITGADGKASITYTCDTLPPGSVILSRDGRVRAGTTTSDTDANYTCVARYSVLPVTPRENFIPPSSTGTAEVEVRDVNGQPWAGKTVNWFSNDGAQINVAAATSVTNASGRASMAFSTSPSFVASSIGASIPEIFTRTLFYRTDPGTISVLIVSGNYQSAPVGSPLPEPVVLEVRNGAGNPLPGRTVSFGGSNNIGGPETTSSPVTAVTNAAGQASFTVTPHVTGAHFCNGVDTLTGSPAIGRCYGTGVDTMTVVSGDRQSGLPGTHSATPVVIEMRNASSNPIVGRVVSWNVNGGSAVFDAATSVTDAAGRASMGFTHGPLPGFSGLEARDSSTQVRVGFEAIGITADSFALISGSGQSGTSGAAAAQPMVAEVRDSAGNPAVGRSISWSATGGAVLAAATTITDAAGRASNSFSYPTVSSPTFGVILAVDPLTSRSLSFNYAVGVSQPALQFVSGNGQSGLPGTAGAQPVVIELRSPTNAPVPGQTIAWSVVSGPAALGTVSNTTDAAGQASASFNFGATAGASLIQARDVATGQLLQAAVTSLGNNQALTVVSGDAQTLIAGTTSEPLVVQLKNFSNVPVVGATVDWTTSAGTLANASSVTDANGQAINTVTTTEAGAVTVRASSVLASAPVTFTLTTGIADLPNLTPQQQSVAGAVDILCPALASKPSLTPQEADLLARCQELAAAAQLNPGATANALQELLSDTGQAQSNAAAAAVGAQFQNINTRLNTLRTGAPMPVSLSGLSFTGSGGVIPLASLMSALAGDEKSPQKEQVFSRWGFFASGNIGRGESDAQRSSPAYDYDIEGITAGLDYRKSDQLVLGAALGFTRQDTELASGQGNVEMSGWSLSSYGTYSFKDKWYVDSVLTWGRNQYEMNRRIAFTVPRPGGGSASINQLATGTPDGDLLSLALTFGGDFHKKALGISPYGQVLYSRTSFDGYEESLLAGAGSGLGLAVEPREVTGLTGVLGSRFTYTHSTDWGVVIPTASVEWTHEFKGDAEAITASFIFDPTHTLFSVAGTPTDSDYLRMSVGLSMVLARGRSGFFQYQWMAAREGQSQYNLSLGFRIEF